MVNVTYSLDNSHTEQISRQTYTQSFAKTFLQNSFLLCVSLFANADKNFMDRVFLNRE